METQVGVQEREYRSGGGGCCGGWGGGGSV